MKWSLNTTNYLDYPATIIWSVDKTCPIISACQKKKNYLRSHNPMILFGKKTVRPLPENDITRSINNSKNTSYMTIPIWGRYSKISITDVGKDLVSRMYIGTVFIHDDIVNTKCPILRNWLTKIWDVPTEEDLQSWQRWRECTMT